MKFYKKQAGFTLSELLVVMAIIGFISAAVTMTFGLVTKTSSTAMEQNSALSQVHMAGSWISRDLKNASNVAVDNATVLCTMTCYVWDDVVKDFGPDQVITYRVEGGDLKRDSRPSGGTLETITVARYIDPDHTTFVPEPGDLSGVYYKLTVTAVPGVTRVFKIKQGSKDS